MYQTLKDNGESEINPEFKIIDTCLMFPFLRCSSV